MSISAPTADGFASLAAELSVPGVAAIEANISCPNIEEDGKAFAMRPESTEKVTREMRAATRLPLWVKLTPNTGDIAEVARAAEAAGADAHWWQTRSFPCRSIWPASAVSATSWEGCPGRRSNRSCCDTSISAPAGSHPDHRLRWHHDGRGRGRVHAGRRDRGTGGHRDFRTACGDDRHHRRHCGFLHRIAKFRASPI